MNINIKSAIEYDTVTYTNIEVCNDLLTSFEEEGYTYLHCTYFTSPRYKRGWWVNINKESYLINGKETIKMIQAINIPLSPEKHYLKKFGDCLRFTLIFPAVPNHWSCFNFIERMARGLTLHETVDSNDGSKTISYHESKGLYINNIVRNNSGVYRVKIQ